MTHGAQGLRVFTLDTIHLQPDVPLARHLFAELLSVRAESYGADHGPTYVPYVGTDYVAQHHLFCTPEPTGPRALGALTLVSLETCDRFGLTFPLLDIARQLRVPVFTTAIEQLIEQHRASGRPLFHGSGFCVRPRYRHEGTERATLLRELCIATLVEAISPLGSAKAVGRAVSGKTVRFFESAGLQPLAHEGVPLPVLPAPPFTTGVVYVEFTQPSPWALECFSRCQPLLRERVRVAPDAPLPRAVGE